MDGAAAGQENILEMVGLPVIGSVPLADPGLDVAGIYLVDKPVGPSSFRIVQMVRRLLGIKKTGHAGTLDPFASGLLIVCAGRPATKLISQLMAGEKEYEATLALGVESFATCPRRFPIGHKLSVVGEFDGAGLAFAVRWILRSLHSDDSIGTTVADLRTRSSPIGGNFLLLEMQADLALRGARCSVGTAYLSLKRRKVCTAIVISPCSGSRRGIPW